MFILATALAAKKPPMVQATAEGMARCPADRVAAWRDASAHPPKSKPARDALAAEYDRSIAEWAVCAHLRQIGSWSVPPVRDPAALAIVNAAIVEVGARARIEGIEAAAPRMPAAAGVLALEELGLLEVVGRAKPPDRLDLVAAALGPWGCPDARTWATTPDGQEVGLCPGTDAAEVAGRALSRLVWLAQPTLDPEAPLAVLLAPDIGSMWMRVEAVEIPIPGEPSRMLHATRAGAEIVALEVQGE
jgi:hypothetical protein